MTYYIGQLFKSCGAKTKHQTISLSTWNTDQSFDRFLISNAKTICYWCIIKFITINPQTTYLLEIEYSYIYFQQCTAIQLPYYEFKWFALDLDFTHKILTPNYPRTNVPTESWTAQKSQSRATLILILFFVST